MADEEYGVNRTSWLEGLSFRHIFKCFSMVRSFSKMALALSAVVLIWLWGWVLDFISGPVCGVYVRSGEIRQYVSSSPTAFCKWREAGEENLPAQLEKSWRAAHAEGQSLTAFQRLLADEGGSGGEFEAAFLEKRRVTTRPAIPDLPGEEARRKQIEEEGLGVLDEIAAIQAAEIERIEALIDLAEEAAEKKVKDAGKSKDAADGAEALEKLEEDVAAARRAVTRRRLMMSAELRNLRGVGVFEAFSEYEKYCLGSALYAVRHGNILGNLKGYRQMLANRTTLIAPPAPTHGLEGLSPAPADDPPGLVFWLLLAGGGFCWLVTQHWLFALFFLVVALAIWALFGGAMHRIAALHFARDERISLGQALRFSAGKFLSFLTAPLIPLAIVLVIGLFMILGGLLMSIPVVDLLMAALFPLALLGGALIAFLLIGLVGGGLLMYPTIAVESSDSADAISRSYSYLFARPWRAIFYGLVAAGYGTLCYLFVRLFVFLMLAGAHGFVSAGVIGGGGAISPAADKLDVLWPAPTFDVLMPAWQAETMTGWESVVAWVVRFWVFLAASLVTAFLLAFLSSASTVIYFLLRRETDATDLDDIYVEEPEEEPVISAPEPEPAAEEKPEGEGAGAEEPAAEGAGEGESEPSDEQPAEGEGPAEGDDSKT